MTPDRLDALMGVISDMARRVDSWERADAQRKIDARVATTMTTIEK